MNKVNNFMNDVEIKLSIKENKYNIPLNLLFDFAVSDYKIKELIPISTVVGCFSPSKTYIPLLMGALLANEISSDKYLYEIRDSIINSIGNENSRLKILMEYLENNRLYIYRKTLLIGLDNVSPSIGHATFNYLDGNINFIHTTKEEMLNLTSDACYKNYTTNTKHFCYGEKRELFRALDRVVIVDSDVSTGIMDLIKDIYIKYGIKEYEYVSIVDMRSVKDLDEYEKFQKELGINITFKSLIKGEYKNQFNDLKLDKKEVVYEQSNISVRVKQIQSSYVHYNKIKNSNPEREHFLVGTGKFGVNRKNHELYINEITEKTKRYNPTINKNTLVIGFGEFSFIPMMITNSINKDSDFLIPTNVRVLTSNEEGYPIKSVDKIACPNGTNHYYYLYNLEDKDYDNVVVFLEREPQRSFIEEMKMILYKRKIKQLEIIHY